jgi:hypothetical protein
VKSGPDEPLEAQEEPQEKDQKGLRGFFNKLRNRSSKSEAEPPQQHNKLKKAHEDDSTPKKSGDSRLEDLKLLRKDEPVTAAAASTETEAPKHSIDSTEPSSSKPQEPGAASPSSFKRHEPYSPRMSEVSSSGADEDDVNRGRRSYDKPISAYLKAEFGLGDLSKGLQLDGLGEKVDKKSQEPHEEEQFEEARDHFDESLVPPSAFGGQAKNLNQSPVRETRFREEV